MLQLLTKHLYKLLVTALDKTVGESFSCKIMPLKYLLIIFLLTIIKAANIKSMFLLLNSRTSTIYCWTLYILHTYFSDD